MHWITWIIAGWIAGWATGKIMSGHGYGALWDIVLGIAGALVGGEIMRLFGFAGRGGFIYTVIIAIVGACLLTWIVRLITRGHRGDIARGGPTDIRRAA